MRLCAGPESAVQFAEKPVDVFDAFSHFFRSFHMPSKGESPMDRGLLAGVSTGTYTSTIVPSLIGTSLERIISMNHYCPANAIRSIANPFVCRGCAGIWLAAI
jgi:hypothetical protein